MACDRYTAMPAIRNCHLWKVKIIFQILPHQEEYLRGCDPVQMWYTNEMCSTFSISQLIYNFAEALSEEYDMLLYLTRSHICTKKKKKSKCDSDLIMSRYLHLRHTDSLLLLSVLVGWLQGPLLFIQSILKTANVWPPNARTQVTVSPHGCYRHTGGSYILFHH